MEEVDSSDSFDSQEEDQNEDSQNVTSVPYKPKDRDFTDVLFGRVLLVATNALLLLSNYVVYKFFLQRWFREERIFYQMVRGIELDNTGTCLFILFQTFFFLSYISYLRAAFTDPGYMTKLEPPVEYIEENLLTFCKRCKDNKWKPTRAHHCKTCQKCVFRMDHHCTWINNCVGIRNQKYFILFLLHCFTYCVLVVIYLAFSGLILYLNTPKLFMLFIGISWKHIIAILFIVLSVLFLFLISSFLGDQIDAIKTNQTTVESYKEQYGRPLTFFNSVNQIFGTSQLHWFLPTKPRYDCNYLELLYRADHIDEIQQTNSEFFEDQFNNKENELFSFFRKYKVKQ